MKDYLSVQQLLKKVLLLAMIYFIVLKESIFE